MKALSFIAGPAAGPIDPSYDYTSFTEVVRSAEDAYKQAGIEDPRAELAMAEVHDCFTPTELVLMEDLGFAERGFAWKECLAGTYDLDGELPVNPDGGLKSFGHPIGASGLRMLFEAWTQLRGEAGDAPDQEHRAGQAQGADAQPRRQPRRLRQLRERRRRPARRVARSGQDPLRPALSAPPAIRVLRCTRVFRAGGPRMKHSDVPCRGLQDEGVQCDQIDDVAAAGLAMAATLVVAACGDDKDDAASTTTAAAASTTGAVDHDVGGRCAPRRRPARAASAGARRYAATLEEEIPKVMAANAIPGVVDPHQVAGPG